ncbi:MAG: S9 family peptidase [Erythrobacter sp.]
MTAQDLITMPRLGTPTVSRFGRYAVYSVSQTDAEKYARTTAYYILDLSIPGLSPVPLNLGLEAYSLTFGADDFLYFISYQHTDPTIPTKGRVWRVALEGNGNVTGPIPVADIPGASIDGFELSPTGDRIALWAETGRDCTRIGCSEGVDAHLTGPGDGRLYHGDEGFFRHWDTWAKPGALNRTFVFGLENGSTVGEGIPVDGFDQSFGVRGDTPTKPFGGDEDVAWAPDGSGLYFVARETGQGEPFSTDLDIFYSDLTGAAPTALTSSNRALDANPTPSPDGKYLAYLAMARPGYESDRQLVQLRTIKSGKTKPLTLDVDLSFVSLAWTEDSRYLLAVAYDTLDTPVYRINVKSGEVRKLNLMDGNEAHISAVMPLSDGRILFKRDSIGAPAELFLSQGLGQGQRLTDIARSRMAQMAPVETKRFNFPGAGGATVWGQITRLKDQTGSIPAILYIHGGPQGSFNDSWSSRWNPRVLASQGYAVISVDFHGSVGYGQAFTDAINRDWGGKPLIDLQLGLQAALAQDPQIDGNRACAMGASYGGYMVNWIAGNWPDRFDCLIQHDGLFDMRSFYYSTEELWFPRWDFGGSYAESKDVYERWNPVNHVDKWKTPMLVIAGEQDFRVPYTQGLQSFTALKERGIESQLLIFPDENHWVIGAKNSLQWHETVFGWLDRWLAPKPAVQSETAP